MKTREEILSILAAHKTEFRRRYKVRRIALFGSFARNEQGPASDVDILVHVDPSIGLDFVTLAEDTEKLVGLPVHLVSRRAVNARHMKYIRSDLIYV